MKIFTKSIQTFKNKDKLIYLVIANCIRIKLLWFLKLRWQRLFDSKVRLYTGTSIRDMFNSKRHYIFRADGEHQQVRGRIYDPTWCDFPNSLPYAKRKQRMGDFFADVIDHRVKPSVYDK